MQYVAPLCGAKCITCGATKWCQVHYTVHEMVHYIVHDMVHYIVHDMVHYMVHYTVQ